MKHAVAWTLLAFVLAICIACGGDLEVPNNAAVPPQPANPIADKQAQAPRTEALGSGGNPAGIGQSIQREGVEVTLVSARFGKVQSRSALGDSSTSKDYVQVKVTIRNGTPARKVEYHRWGQDDIDYFDGQRHTAWLEDEFSNSYKRLEPALAEQFVGAAEQNPSLHPGHSITDLIVFEAPIAEAQTLTLHLPLDAISLKGKDLVFRFESPRLTEIRKAEAAAEARIAQRAAHQAALEAQIEDKPNPFAPKKAAQPKPREFEGRTWSLADGTTIDAKLVKAGAGKVTLEKEDGETTVVAMDELSDEDQEWIRKQARKR